MTVTSPLPPTSPFHRFSRLSRNPFCLCTACSFSVQSQRKLSQNRRQPSSAANCLTLRRYLRQDTEWLGRRRRSPRSSYRIMCLYQQPRPTDLLRWSKSRNNRPTATPFNPPSPIIMPEPTPTTTEAAPVSPRHRLMSQKSCLMHQSAVIR
ncbi:hypothetical protein F5887DRAFT_221712 [Amanita rubescens]|nr:hypothetical protein F5887DRAFT_221712 [Amanita rubescens]